MFSNIFLCSGLIDWLEKRQFPCFYKSMFGIDCPGCGIQRAFIALLRGDFLESLKLYPALIPILAMFVFLIVHLFYHLKNGAKILMWMFILNGVIIFISYIYKLFV